MKKTVKLGTVVDPNFLKVLRYIVETEKPVKAKAAYAISQILAKVQKEKDHYDSIRTTLIKKYCKKKEDGEVMVDETGNASFESPEARTAFTQELQELLDVDVEMGQINVQDIEAFEIKPMDMLTIQEVVYEN